MKLTEGREEMSLTKKLLLDSAPSTPADGLQSAVLALAATADVRGHTRRVSGVATMLARLMGLTPADVETVRLAALLHDVGKIAIPDRILARPDAMSPDERHLLQLHPIFGASILTRVPGLDKVVSVVLHHHERWDGGGFPKGLAGVDIPLESRIVTVANAFDALTRFRGHDRDAESALKEMRKGSGREFDPLAVDALLEAYKLGLLDDTLGATTS